MDRLMGEWVLRLAEELAQIIPVRQPFVKHHTGRCGAGEQGRI